MHIKLGLPSPSRWFVLAATLFVLAGASFPAPVYAISLRDSTQNSSVGTAVSVTRPTGTTAGDVVIIVINTNGSSVSITDNNGSTPFTEDLAEYSPTVDGQTLSIFSRRIQGGDPSTYNFTIGSSQRWGIVAATYQDPNPDQIYDVAPSAGNGNCCGDSTIDVDSIDTTIDGSIHVAVGMADGSNNPAVSSPATYTLRENINSSGQNIAYADKVISPPGATGTQTFTWAGDETYSMSFAVAAIAPEIEQEGFRWRADDGDEDAASWLAVQDIDITRAANLTTRLRLLLNSTDDPSSMQYQLEYKEDSATAWQKVISASGFPSIVATSTTNGTTLSGGATLNMPSGIQAGDLLIAFACNDAPTGGMDISGWTELFDSYWGTDTSAATRIVTHAAWAKIAAGSDTATLTGSSQDYAAVVARITKHGVSTIATDIKMGTVATTTANQTPNPPSLDAGSSAKWLWLASFGADDDDSTQTWESTDYTGVGWAESAESTSSCMTAVEYRQNETQTEDPGIMLMVASEEWIAQTIAIPPFVEQITLSASSNITASGENTTAQLTAPAGKTTSDFDAGRMQDDENPADAVDITTDDYTEMEWSIIAVNGVAQDGEIYQFRVTTSGTALDTYSVTPEWTIGATPGGGGDEQAIKIIRLLGGRFHGVRLQ